MTRETARTIEQWMRGVVEYGTGRYLRLKSDVSIAGKTGTAETATGAAHAWFIGFAPADAPEIAFAVVVEHGGYGSTGAAPVGAKIAEAYLAQREDTPR